MVEPSSTSFTFCVHAAKALVRLGGCAFRPFTAKCKCDKYLTDDLITIADLEALDMEISPGFERG